MNFDRLAPWYRSMESVLAGTQLQRLRRRWMASVPPSAAVLIAGDGHGRGAAALLRAVPSAKLTIVEQSGRMIETARVQLERGGLDLGRVHWICRDIRNWETTERFDVVVTQFFLDCFRPRDVTRIVEKLARTARERALWLLCDFRVPERGVRRSRARVIHALMYAFFRRAAGLEARRWTSPDPALRRAGFALLAREERSLGLLHTDLWRRSWAA